MKVLAFSLFGSDPIYTVGAIRNAELAPKIYPGWTCVFYVGNEVKKETVGKLSTLGAEVRFGDPDIKNEMFWRFLIADDPAVEWFVIRDCDSRLSVREYRAVQEWQASGLQYHSMRDHPYHTLPMGGGLWGGSGKMQMRERITDSGLATQKYERNTAYGLDQSFLSQWIWPHAKASCMAHDSCNRRIYPDSRPFPNGCRFGENRFVGEVIDENENPHPIHWQQRITHMTK